MSPSTLRRSLPLLLLYPLPFLVAACSGADAREGGSRERARRTIPAGTVVELRADREVSSRTAKVGEAVTATIAAAVRDERGTVVIPAGAVFVGTVRAIAPAEKPGEPGVLRLGFSAFRHGGRTVPIEARVTYLTTRMQGRGVTGGEALKVGAGAAAGAVAGRIIGGNRTGTIVGGVVGAAGGAGYAAATRDVDVVLPAGGMIRLVLTAPLAA